ncbi:MAG: pilus assembly protein [Chloroflexi bacterium]|nr:pilus assembly protein [Chloroflexota bacterium]
MHLRPPDRESHGQSLVELALVLPALMLMLLSILQIGFLLNTQVGLTNAAREAARNASSIIVVSKSDATPAATTYYARLTDASTGFLKRNVSGYDPSRLVEAGTPRTSVCYYSIVDASSAPAIMARVEVEYSHSLFVPLLSAILDGFDGNSDGGLRLGAVETIRVGNGVLTTTDIGDINAMTCQP